MDLLQAPAGDVSQTREFSVPPELEGSRLDRCLAALDESWSRSRARHLIDAGRVLLNGRFAKAAAPVTVGDVIVVDEPSPPSTELEPEAIPLDILYEDDDVLVLDKPPDLVIHPAAGRSSGTLVNALLEHCSELSSIAGAERPGIVHRLDRDTSGLMVVAKSERAHLALSLAFRRRQVRKVYLAVCYGEPTPGEGVIDAPIGRHPSQRQRMAVVAQGRSARTLYTVQERFRGTALVSCRPVTGRTHQIRVHMAHIGHAIVGDPTYAGRQWRNLEVARHAAACRSFPRQALHAHQLGFVHPVSGEELQFSSPLPEDIAALIAVLRGT